jgi:hypothetical protein
MWGARRRRIEFSDPGLLVADNRVVMVDHRWVVALPAWSTRTNSGRPRGTILLGSRRGSTHCPCIRLQTPDALSNVFTLANQRCDIPPTAFCALAGPPFAK